MTVVTTCFFLVILPNKSLLKMKKTIFFTLLVLFTSCKVKQTAIAPTISTQPTSINSFCQEIQKNEPSFNTVDIKKISIRAKINQQENYLSGGIKIQTDSFIFISLQPLPGFEMFRIEFYPEKFRFFDKMNRKYFEATYEYIEQTTKIPLQYKNLEDLFSRKLFVLGRKLESTTFNSIFSLSTQNGFVLASQSADGRIQQDIKVSPELLIDNIKMSQYLKGNSLSANYSGNYSNKNPFPEKISISMAIFNRFSAEIEMDLQKPIFDKSLNEKPTQLDRYTRVSLNDFFKK